MQFPNQDKAICDGGHECDRSRLYLGQTSVCDRTKVRVDYETEISGTVNWCQTDISSKWKRMTGKFGKLLWPASEKKFRCLLDLKPAGLQTSSWIWNKRHWRVQ